jgi:hypothetical protein
MNASVELAADAPAETRLNGRADAKRREPPSRRAEHDVWAPLVMATIWWGLFAFASVWALLPW